jgi:nucleolar protein 14
MAGGTQLKKLRESLKNAGLSGQSNFGKKSKGKGRKNGAQDKLRKDDKEKILNEIREQFNPFDVKVTKNKRADAMQKKLTVGKPGITKQIGEENRRREFESKMERKGKAGGIIDRRFGEGNSKLSSEEKMLERFTKERLSKANKSSMYNLDDDDDNIDFAKDGDFGGLTHLGQSLSGKNTDSIDDDDFFSKKRTVDEDEDNDNDNLEAPFKKKTKAEVMKEVIAKSKKYKHERQKAHLENQEIVEELDDNFENVMDEISTVNRGKTENDEKSKYNVNYEMKVTEAKLDKRAKPTDRTKTEEEIKKEEEERQTENERKRQQRMDGDLEEEEEIRESGVAGDDLGDDFWTGSGDEETGFSIGSPKEFDSESDKEPESEPESESEGDDNDKINKEVKLKENVITIGNKKVIVKPKVSQAKLKCPNTLEEFKQYITPGAYESTLETIKKIFETYQPKLAEGNKMKLGVFTTVLFEYLLELSNEPIGFENKQYVRLMDFLTRSICNLTEKYQEVLLESFREHLENSHQRFLSQDSKSFPLKSDAILLTLVGRTFSTSDKFHLVVIPALLVACEALEYMRPENNKTDLFFGIFLCDLLIHYERISQRFIPEIITFLQRVLISIVPDPENIEDWDKILICSTKPKHTEFTRKNNTELSSDDIKLSISKMWELSKSTNAKDTTTFIDYMLMKSIRTLDTVISQMIKNTLAAPELTSSFIPILRHLIKTTKNTNATIINVASKLTNINRIANQERRPLKLQTHRAIGIAQVAPRFSERFNPDRKSNHSIDMDPMDPIAVRDEISKLKHQVKEERKQALKELRRDTKFEARAQIGRKKKEYEEYHSKMAKIYNSIQTEEGTAKNLYEKEKKARKNRK